jgi:hypothetical protein
MKKYIPALLALALLLAHPALAEETGLPRGMEGGTEQDQTLFGAPLTGEQGPLVAPAEAAKPAPVADPAELAPAITACTQMWCQEGLTLNLNGSDWPAGKYDFVVMLDGKVTRCKAELPFKTCDTNVTCSSSDVTIGESGCALPPESHSFNSITSKLSPTEIGIAIRRGDGKFFAWEKAIQKICTYPNGLKCDQRECCSVYAEADVNWEDQPPRKQ